MDLQNNSITHQVIDNNGSSEQDLNNKIDILCQDLNIDKLINKFSEIQFTELCDLIKNISHCRENINHQCKIKQDELEKINVMYGKRCSELEQIESNLNLINEKYNIMKNKMQEISYDYDKKIENHTQLINKIKIKEEKMMETLINIDNCIKYNTEKCNKLIQSLQSLLI